MKKEAYKTANSHGWHDKEHSDEHYLMLIVTEVAEAVQADRKGKYADVARFKEWQTYYGSFLPPEETRTIRFKEDFEAYVKNSVEDELADIVIRCFDLAGLKGIDLTYLLDDIDRMPVNMFDELTFAETAYDMCFPLVTINAEHAVKEVIVYVFHYCKVKGINIEWFIEQKMKYNRLRPYKHGGKKY